MSELSLRIAELSPEKRELLLRRLNEKQGGASRASITPQPKDSKGVSLSFAQQRLWFLDQLDPGTPLYNLPVAIRLTGPLDADLLQRSVHEIVRRHDALRTIFVAGAASDDGQPVQVIRPTLTIPLERIDLRVYPASEREAEVERRINAEAQIPFDLARGPLLRTSLLQLDDQEHILLLTIHHIVADGWSVVVFIRELGAIYPALAAGLAVPLAALPIQYADFAIWQSATFRGNEQQALQDYWTQRLSEAPPVLELPADRPRQAGRGFRGGRCTLTLPESLSEALRALSRQEDASLFMTLLAAFKVLLCRYTGQPDLVVGTPIAGRTRKETEGLIGCFLNMLALRTDLSGRPTFRETLRRVRETALGAYAHQDLPFEKLLELLQPERDLSYTPLFQVLFNMLNVPDVRLALPGLELELLGQPEIGSKFDLTLYVFEQDDQIQLDAVYDADRFTAARMTEMLEQFGLLLSQVVARPDEWIDQFTLVTPSAQVHLPNPQSPLEVSWDGTALAGFARQARRGPDRRAIVDAQEVWTYAKLDAESNQLANYLIDQGIQPQDVVAIYGHRSATLVLALLGILKAGAAFLILDPAYPPARLIDQVRTAQPKGWVQIEDAGALPDDLEAAVPEAALSCRLLLPRSAVAAARGLLSGYPTTDPKVAVDPDDLAYIAFTSGSTGRAKAIAGTHRPLSHFLKWHCQTFWLTSADRFSMLGGLAHDPLLRDIFTPLSIGATLYIPDPESMGALGYLGDWMQHAGISVTHLTPTMAHLLIDSLTGARSVFADRATLPALRYAFFGADVLTQHEIGRFQRIAPGATCVNFYGATETPQAMGYYAIPKQDLSDDSDERPADAQMKMQIPLGQGIKDVQLLVINAAQQLAGIGELGEIYIRTPYLTRGYLNNDALTQERFIPNPFTGGADDRMYRTGDLGRYLPDGTVVFCGRADQQVKIRGFRVELGEIEATLRQHPAVREALAVVREDVPGDKRLVAYVVENKEQRTENKEDSENKRTENREDSENKGTREQENKEDSSDSGSGFSVLGSSDLRAYLRSRLPNYMIPAAFVLLDALPVTPNGKIDRNALPRPDALRGGLETTYAAPETEIERAIASIWQEVLHIEMVGLDDNFFDLGGNSMQIIQVQSKIRATLNKDLLVVDMFKYPTVGLLAKHLNEEETAQPSFEHVRDRAEQQRLALEAVQVTDIQAVLSKLSR